jgi:redox-sensitive bicupin YhaK (pirin superfamily)
VDVLKPHERDLGGGLIVSRVLPGFPHQMVGPFIFFDQMGPGEFLVGRGLDVRPHPHIGLATVTYLFEGEIMHRDSVGSEQPIRPGEVNWMIAGRGITHSERFEKARAQGGAMHGIQAWVALPDGSEEIAPGFAHHEGGQLPLIEYGRATLRLIAGRAYGQKAATETLSPLFYVHAELHAGGIVELPDTYPERAAYVVSGRVESSGELFHPGQMLVFKSGEPAHLRAEEQSLVMLLGGDPVGPRFIEWNFVSSSRERIEQAKADWRAGRMKLPDLDHGEFIPLPPDPPPPANPMS